MKFTLRIKVHGLCTNCGKALTCGAVLHSTPLSKGSDMVVVSEQITRIMHKIEGYDCPHCSAPHTDINPVWDVGLR